ncbi:DUF2510 domain-containing protein [Curtobacterium sp. MCLR17_007]|uniref:DUF2510 domain-containing protein n=1 Tax=Curtobacterium sp. MCLR17_007 TaxID=2175648 RepID=UPI000DA7DCD5|nr:DUF2510 domain-containing protein [Curtobacterium sp. MCLR17_007]WIB60896.1 DUF2510 domain-containing protein [Curtobacterium sp. MCLR17_007]
MSSVTPPGWYPDPSGRYGTRWWDGTQWTQQLGPPLSQIPRPRIADTTRTDTVFVWVLALLPLVTVPLLLTYQPHFRYESIGPSHIRSIDPTSIYTAGYLLVQGASLLLYAANVLLAFFDHRALTRRGVVRPFPWPWVFLSSIVYVIGRYVVVRKVAPGRAMWPLWVLMAVSVIGAVVGITRSVALFHQMLL